MKHYIQGHVVDKNLQPTESGFVSLIWQPQGDVEKIIVDAARVSHNEHENNHTHVQNEHLIRYMWRHRHTSPFEHVSFTFLVRAPIFVVRQWFRHRTGKYNEISARYTKLKDAFWMPTEDDLRKQSTTNHQSSIEEPLLLDNLLWLSANELTKTAYDLYENFIDNGVAREIARSVLPLNIMTEFYFTIDLHNLLHFIELRIAPDAQKEIRLYAEAISNIIKPLIPTTWKAFEDFTLNAVTFTGPEIQAFKKLKIQLQIPADFPTNREKNEFSEKLKKVFE